MNKVYDKGDYCLRSSLYAASLLMRGQNLFADVVILPMEEECLPTSFFRARKSLEYRWSDSGSENPSENTLLKRPTYWLWKHILRHVGVNPYKGLNGDQMRAYFIYLYLRKQKMKSLKIIIGFILRLGFFPSLMENILFKPQTAVLLLATIWKPLWYTVYPFYTASESKNLMEPIEVGTTNKISLLMTMWCLGRELPLMNYIERVYRTYFHDDLKFLADSIVLGFELNN